MTDRELLELAATAAGYEWRKDIAEYRNDRGIVGLWIINPVATGWNPLDTDGDALRLAGLLNIDLEINDMGIDTWVNAENYDDGVHVYEECGDDKMVSIRRAIVLAAAELGKRTGGAA